MQYGVRWRRWSGSLRINASNPPVHQEPEVRNASSIIDYVFRWMAIQFIPGYREANSPNRNQQELAIPVFSKRRKKK